ncbi:secretoglobin family 1D member 2-like [Rhinolophus ferrumequinum]|uniref:secretoglobin family 1D member 2-like n=1 Tax=Rhinolophus ferrumequinum TaxID=59479 RepID=UPI00140F6B90|nr:secretoglobin family 1D member 2-like [Rhinolophus ferrumequinum]
MRLSFPVLLVTLAFCCSEANAKVCPSLLMKLRSFIMDPTPIFKIVLLKYNAPPEAYQAELEVKKCINQISFSDRRTMINIMLKMVSTCNS